MRVNLLVAAAVLAGMGACTSSPPSPSPSPSPTPSAAVTGPPPPGAYDLRCDHVIGHENPPDPRRTVVLDAVALPIGVTLQANDVGRPEGPAQFFAKAGLVVREGTVVELSLSESWADRARLGWGNSDRSGPAVRFPGCAGSGWVAFAGGYYVDRPACVPLLVRSGGREEIVHIGVGVPC